MITAKSACVSISYRYVYNLVTTGYKRVCVCVCVCACACELWFSVTLHETQKVIILEFLRKLLRLLFSY